MMWFFITTLLISIVGMVSMILIKRWELRTGKMVMRNRRPGVARAVRTTAFVTGTVAPLVARHWWEYGVEWTKLRLHRATAWTVIHTERGLEKVLHTIRHSTAPERVGEASEFLREVAEHKKQIQENAPEQYRAE